MGTLSIEMGDGNVRQVQVDDAFNSLSPDDQNGMVNHIRATLDGAAPTAAPVDTSFTGALGYGAKNVGQGLAATARVAGDGTGSQTLQDVGKSLQSMSGGASNYDPATPRLVDDIRQGNYGDALSYAPRAAVETAPDMLAALATARVAGPAGLAAYLSARGYGQNVEARAANNNHQTPTTGDLVGGAVSTVPQVALGMAGLGRLPGVGAALESVPTAAGRVVAGAGADALAGAAADVAGQVGNTAGTDRGLSVDPAEAAAAGLVQGTARAGSLSGSEAASMAGTAASAATGATFDTPTTDAAQSIARVNQAADNYRSMVRDTVGRTPSDRATLDGLQRQLQGNATEIGRQLVAAGAITADDHRSVVQPAIREATAFRPDRPDDTGPLPFGSSLADLSIPDDIKGPLIAAVADLATVTAARRGDATGPFEKLGHATATIGTAGGLLAAGQPVAAAGALVGAREVSRLGGLAGGVLDRLAGTAAPAVFLRAGQAQRVLQGAGLTAGDDAITATTKALATLRDPQARLNLSLGLPLDTPATPQPPPAPDPIQARGLNLAEQAGRTIEQQAVQQAKARGQAMAAATGQPVGNDPDALRTAAQGPTDEASVDPVPWQPGAPPIGLQVIQAAAQRSRLAQMADVADRNSVPSIAQRQVNQASLRNAAALAAENLPPVGQGAEDDTATAAAIAQAGRRAAVVRRLATPPGAAQGGAAPDGTAAPAAIPPASGSLPSGWLAYVLSGLMRAGIAAKPADVHGALDDLVASGELNPAHAAAMKGHPGPIMVPELLQRVAAQTAQRTGQADRLDAGLAGNDESDGATTGRPPVRDPLRWASARDSYQAHAEATANQAERMGDNDLAVTVRQVAAEPTAAGKERIAADYVASIKGTRGEAVLRKARAAQFFTGPLMKGV